MFIIKSTKNWSVNIANKLKYVLSLNDIDNKYFIFTDLCNKQTYKEVNNDYMYTHHYKPSWSRGCMHGRCMREPVWC